MTAGGLAIELKPTCLELSGDLAISGSHDDRIVARSVVVGSESTPPRSLRASMSLRATSRAISSASATVRPWATSPGNSSEVARNRPSGNSST